MVKTAILSTSPIPNEKVGSWVRRIEYYLQRQSNQVDYLICPKRDPQSAQIRIHATQVNVALKQNRFLEKLRSNYKHGDYGKVLIQLVKAHGKFVVLIMDNYKVLFAVHSALSHHKLRNKVRIIFNLCGHSYFFSPGQGHMFYEAIDQVVFLTQSAYQFELQRYHAIPCEASILPNPINPDRFNIPSSELKKTLRDTYGFKNDEKIFLWLSRDRPKKGLGIVLKAWQEFYSSHSNCQLLVLGNQDTRPKLDGVTYKGLIPHDQLPKYLQLADYFIFSTLCFEGYPLSLLEAISCGLTPIASAIGSVIEILEGGKYGYLVDFPHSPHHWAYAFDQVLSSKTLSIKPRQSNYVPFTLKQWTKEIDRYFINWKNDLME